MSVSKVLNNFIQKVFNFIDDLNNEQIKNISDCYVDKKGEE